jgi:hypothetical protein
VYNTKISVVNEPAHPFVSGEGIAALKTLYDLTPVAIMKIEG